MRVDRGGRRRLHALRWGFVPFWIKDPAIGRRLVNACDAVTFDMSSARGPELKAWPVIKAVNDPRNDDERLLARETSDPSGATAARAGSDAPDT